METGFTGLFEKKNKNKNVFLTVISVVFKQQSHNMLFSRDLSEIFWFWASFLLRSNNREGIAPFVIAGRVPIEEA
jgi:hypothetical protein